MVCFISYMNIDVSADNLCPVFCVCDMNKVGMCGRSHVMRQLLSALFWLRTNQHGQAL